MRLQGALARVAPAPTAMTFHDSGTPPNLLGHASHMKQLNLVFLAVLVIVLAALGGTTHLVYTYQVRRHASALLDRARQAEADNDLAKAAESLGQYLTIKREDGPAWAWYARLVDQRNPEGSGREQVYLVHEQALRFNSGDPQLERKCADLAMELERYSDARRYSTLLYNRAPKDPSGEPVDAILEDLLGQCDRGESKLPEAEGWFRKAIAHEPGQVDTYDHLARLLQTERRQLDEADRLIESMVKANPKSARAYLNRWRYRSEFLQNADPRDLQQALTLDPDEAEVLIVAAELAQEGNDLAGARKHLERGLERHPANAVFYRMSAGLEQAENHLDRAEMILRKGVAAVPGNVELKIDLLESLIPQGKIDGEDGATSWIERLRQLGLVDGYAQYLEGQVAMVQQKWPQAISRLDSARALLAADPVVVSRINLMLADCYRRMGNRERQITALERAARGKATAAVASPLLAQIMESEGRLDDAIRLHTELLATRPESRRDLLRLLIQKNARLPQDQRRWELVEQRLQEAERALPKAVDDLTLIRADLRAAENRFEAARAVLTSALAKDPRNLKFRLALARVAEREGKNSQTVQILDQAEKDLGPSLDIQLARLEHWRFRGGDEAKDAVAKLAELRNQHPPSRPAFVPRSARPDRAPDRAPCLGPRTLA